MYGPYNLQESLNWIRKYILGPTTDHSFSPAFPPQKIPLRDYTPLFKISFVGDLMSLRDHRLELGPKLSDWIHSSNYLVANLEAPITLKKGFSYLKQYNHPNLLEQLQEIKSPERIYLSVANNHSNDFGNLELAHSIRYLQDAGISAFGTSENPFINIDNKVLIWSATEWSNSSKKGLSLYHPRLLPPEAQQKEISIVNILYPHWGYEFELYPRSHITQTAETLSQYWDAIIGHHSHCPQPISILKTQNKGPCPVAYSLGNFAIAYQKELLNYGIILTLSVGSTLTPSTFVPSFTIGELSWSFIKIQPPERLRGSRSSQTVFVELCDDCPYFPKF